MRNFSEKKNRRENQNPHFVFNNFFFFENCCSLCFNVEECGTARQATDDQAVFLLDKQRCRHTLRMCNGCCLFNANSFHANSGYACASHCYVYTYITCLRPLCSGTCRMRGLVKSATKFTVTGVEFEK